MNKAELSFLDDEVLFLRTASCEDKDAFAEIYDRYWKLLVSTCYKRLQCIDSAEELVQDIFIDLYLRRHEITLSSTLEAYLKTAVKYKVFNFYRAQHTHQNYVNKTLAQENIGFPTPDKNLQHKQINAAIVDATRYMPEQCKRVFQLSRIEHLPQKSIANELGISLSTVKKHITKANQILREKLGYIKADLLNLILLLICIR
jgi:RNA polymerase sigma-70 factor (family 1)